MQNRNAVTMTLFVPSDFVAHPLLHWDLVIIADGVFSQEVKLHHILLLVQLGVKFDVLHPQGAAANCVRRLAFFLLVTCPQSQLQGAERETQCPRLSFQLILRWQLKMFTHFVNKIQSDGSLPDPHLFGLPVVSVLRTNPIHALL